MAKFNPPKEEKKYVTNHMGAKAIKETAELELVSLLLSSFAEDSYYETTSEAFTRLNDLIERCDKEFVAKAVVFARTKFGMRSISHVAAAKLAKYISGKDWASKFYNSVIHRPDDMTEIVSFYAANCAEPAKNKRKRKGLPASMRNGFGEALGRFNEYSLGKYRSEKKDFKLIDVVNMVHPKPTEKNSIALKALVEGTLKSTDTWEVNLTKAGQTGKTEEEVLDLKKDAWEKLIKERKIGYFALLRNLRNIMTQAPSVMKEACELLCDKKLIKKSLVLPFRYLTAYNEIEKLGAPGKKVFEKDGLNNKEVLAAIEKAIMISIENLPTLMGKTIILSDNSGSMKGGDGGDSLVSKMSSTTTSHIANLFAMMYWMKADNTLVGLFGEALVHPDLDRKKGLFDNFKIVDKASERCGGATEAGIFEMFRRLIKDKIIANTIVIFSDCQIGDGCGWYGNRSNGEGGGVDFMKLFSDYKKINPDVRCYSVNLKGYGTTVFDGSVIKIGGWSEKIFDIMKNAEQDKSAMLNEIKAISFDRNQIFSPQNETSVVENLSL